MFFPPHFIDNPIVPGFILAECLVQVFIMTFLTMENNNGSTATDLSSSSSSSFHLEVKPGDCLYTEANLDFYKWGVARGSAHRYVNDKIACKASYNVCIPFYNEKI